MLRTAVESTLRAGSESDLRSPALASVLHPAPTAHLLLTKGGLLERAEAVAAGTAPRDFFYGFLGLLARGLDARMVSTSAGYSGMAGAAHRFAERVFGRLTGISTRRRYLDEIFGCWREARTLVSCTDHFSYTLGHYFRGQDRRARPVTIGLFHGFSDLEAHLTPLGRMIAPHYVSRALQGLDFVGFFGPADREQAIERFGVPRERTGILRFGVDLEFWKPAAEMGGAGVFSIGSDPNRDFQTLVDADVDCPVRIVTRLPVTVPPARRNISVTEGSFAQAALSDLELRSAYQGADVVVAPLKDVFQPTGYSVTLQAMACARPVVLSRIKGLWTPELLVDGENCLLVPPGDPQALAQAVRRLRTDPALARRIGEAGRHTVEQHFSIAHAEQSLIELIEAATGEPLTP